MTQSGRINFLGGFPSSPPLHIPVLPFLAADDEVVLRARKPALRRPEAVAANQDEDNSGDDSDGFFQSVCRLARAWTEHARNIGVPVAPVTEEHRRIHGEFCRGFESIIEEAVQYPPHPPHLVVRDYPRHPQSDDEVRDEVLEIPTPTGDEEVVTPTGDEDIEPWTPVSSHSTNSMDTSELESLKAYAGGEVIEEIIYVPPGMDASSPTLASTEEEATAIDEGQEWALEIAMGGGHRWARQHHDAASHMSTPLEHGMGESDEMHPVPAGGQTLPWTRRNPPLQRMPSEGGGHRGGGGEPPSPDEARTRDDSAEALPSSVGSTSASG